MKNLAFSKKFIFTLFAVLFGVNLWGQEPKTDLIDLGDCTITINNNIPYLCTSTNVTVESSHVSVWYKDDNDDIQYVTSGFTISIVNSENVPVTIGENNFAVGKYTLTVTAITGEGATCENSQTRDFYVLPGSNTYYTISDETDWNRFADCVNDKYSFDGLTVKLTPSSSTLNVTTMVYNDTYPFSGTFDGNNKTLDVSYSGESYYMAPFYYTEGATIKNLNVTGNIVVAKDDDGYGYSAGLIYSNTSGEYVTRNTVVQDVIVSVNITGIDDDDNEIIAGDYCGGFAVYSAYLDFSNCVYNGRIVAGNDCGGFSASYYDSGNATFENCIFDPLEGSAIESGATFATNSTSWTGCYYTDNLGMTEQGVEAFLDEVPAGSIGKDMNNNILGYDVYKKVAVGITGVNNTYLYREEGYTINPVVTFDDVIANNENNYCTVTIVPSTVKEIGEYTLTITSNNSQDYYGSYIKKFYVINANLSGSGTEPDPYIIDSEDDWICFASYVNNDNSEGKYFKLTDNISVTTMVGTPEHPFKGTFTGRIGNTYGAYTLTFNCGSSFYDATSEEIVAPFRYTDGSTIASLIVEGAIHTKVGKEAGLIGVNSFTTGRATTLEYIINNMNFHCYEELWDAEGGGYAYDGSNIHFSYCSYEGTISASNYHGGFCGKANGNTEFVRCLFDPKEGSMYWAENFVYDAQGATINYNGSGSGVEDGCYYSLGNNQEESDQGTMVYVNVVPEENIGHKITTFHEKQIYKPVTVVISGVQKRYVYDNGNELLNISSVGVTFDGGNAITNNWCSKEITNSSSVVVASVSAIGTYTLTITAPKAGVESDYLGTVTMLIRVVESSSAGWTGLQAKLSGSDATINLTENITAGSGDVCLVVEGNNRTVTINLNGYTIDRGFYQNGTWSDPVVGGQVLKVNSGCTVIINGPGTIKGGCNKASSNAEHAENSDGGGIVNRGTLTLNNVIVRDNKCVKVSDNNTSRTARGGGVYSGKNSNLTINGCDITNNSAEGGGGGIFVYQATNFIMNKYDSSVKPNIHSNKSKDKGGGIRVDANNSTNATLNDCDINNNTVEFLSELSVSNGGGIHLDGGILTLNRCEITHNRASKFGGGIYIMGGQLRANDCSINYNMSYDETDRFDGCGGGICLLGGKCYLNGGTISNNSSSVIDGGGIYVNSGTLLSIQGTVNITENWKFISNTGGSIQTTNVYLVKADGKITIAGNLSSSVIGVSKKGDTGVFTSGLNGKGTIANFSSDNSVYSIVSYNNEAKLTTISPVDPPVSGVWEINEPVILKTTVPSVEHNVTSIVIRNNGCLYVNSGGYINGVSITNNTNNAETKLVINGGQVIPSNPGVLATVKKDISYALPLSQGNWYLISSPLVTPTGENPVVYNPISILYNTNLIVKNANNYPEYDLYRFNEGATAQENGYELQWENYRANHNDFTTLAKGRGYLYRNYNNYTITMTGAISIESPINYALSYHSEVNSHDNIFKGFNIIGNPYTHNISKGITGAAIPNTYLEAKYYVLDETDGSWDLTNDGTAIPPVTGILVQAKSANTLTITNSTTVGGSKGVANNNIWFTVANSKYDDRACVEFRYGRGLNKIAHPNENVPMLYIRHNDEDFASVDMNPEAKQFDLYFEAATLGQYTLTVNPQGNYSYLHLIDKVAEEDIDLLEDNEYSFIGSPIDNADRFVVRLENSENAENSVFAYQNGNDIVVCGDGELQVFDVMGRLVMQKYVSGVESIATPMTTGVYIMRLNENTQKIVVR